MAYVGTVSQIILSGAAGSNFYSSTHGTKKERNKLDLYVMFMMTNEHATLLAAI